MEAHHALGNTLHRLGELTAARAHLEQSLALYDAQEHHALAMQYGMDDGVAGLGYSTWVLWSLGYVDQAVHKSKELLHLAQDLAHPLSRAWAYNSVAWQYQFRREAQTAKAWAEAGLALCAEQGFTQLLAVGALVQGWAMAAQGQAEAGIGRMREGLTALRDTGTAIGYPRYLGLLAEAYGAVQQAEVGLSLLSEALAVLEQTGERFYEAELYRLQGTLTLQAQERPARIRGPSTPRPGKAAVHRAQAGAANPRRCAVSPQAEAAAEACFQQAIAIARRQSARTLELRAAVSLSRLWQQQGKKADAHQLLAEVYGWFTEGFDTPDLQEAKALLQELA
jgi:predicted ATPase